MLFCNDLIQLINILILHTNMYRKIDQLTVAAGREDRDDREAHLRRCQHRAERGGERAHAALQETGASVCVSVCMIVCKSIPTHTYMGVCRV